MTESKYIVVIMVMCAVFLGLAIYLFMIDRKTARIEKELKERMKNRRS